MLKFENPGYIYIISNESLPNVLKIGYTQNSPYQRISELYTTGLPTPFVIEQFYFVEDACMCEELIHIRLNRCRVNSDREFFKTDVEKAKRVVEQAIDDMRERLWTGNKLKNEAKNESIITPQFSYSNPKFKEMMKLLKTNRGLLTVEEIAKEIKISPNGVDKIIAMMNKQEGTLLYTREENRVKKYSMALAFNVHQLKLLSERFPDLNLMELQPLFEKPKSKSTPRRFLENKINGKDLSPKLVNPNPSEEDLKKIEQLTKSTSSKLERILNKP